MPRMTSIVRVSAVATGIWRMFITKQSFSDCLWADAALSCLHVLCGGSGHPWVQHCDAFSRCANKTPSRPLSICACLQPVVVYRLLLAARLDRLSR